MEDENIYGKFNSVLDLLNAYNALEAEFTKRCQRLKESERLLNEELAKQSTQGITPKLNNPTILAENNAAEQKNIARADSDLSELNVESPAKLAQAELIALIESDDFIEGVILNSDKITKTVILDYLHRLKENKSGLGEFLSAGVGRAALSPINKPKSLSEAKAVADRYLRGLN